MTREEYISEHWPTDVPGACMIPRNRPGGDIDGEWCCSIEPMPTDACLPCRTYVRLLGEWQRKNILGTLDRMKAARNKEYESYLEAYDKKLNDMKPLELIDKIDPPLSFEAWLEMMAGVSDRLIGRKSDGTEPIKVERLK